MRLQTTLFVSFSLLLSACAVKRPDIEVCVVNGPGEIRKCYNLRDQYDDQGNLKPGAKPIYRENHTVMDLNKAFLVDSKTGFEDGLAGLKAWIQELKAECQPAK